MQHQIDLVFFDHMAERGISQQPVFDRWLTDQRRSRRSEMQERQLSIGRQLGERVVQPGCFPAGSHRQRLPGPVRYGIFWLSGQKPPPEPETPAMPSPEIPRFPCRAYAPRPDSGSSRKLPSAHGAAIVIPHDCHDPNGIRLNELGGELDLRIRPPLVISPGTISTSASPSSARSGGRRRIRSWSGCEDRR